MLVGRLPFKSGNEKDLFRKIQKGKYLIPSGKEVPAEERVDLSNSAKSLIKSLLRVDYSKRSTAEIALESDWIIEN